jgi:putative membrane protein
MGLGMIAAGVLGALAMAMDGPTGVALTAQEYTAGLTASPFPPAAQDLSGQDRVWLDQNAQTAITEARAGRFAEHKATTNALRSTGQRLTQDYLRVLEQVRGEAYRYSWKVPDGPDAIQERQLGELQRLTGAGFDRAFLSYQTQILQSSIRDAQGEIDHGQDPDVIRVAREYLQTAQTAAHYFSSSTLSSFR